jgi:hypothetical protein
MTLVNGCKLLKNIFVKKILFSLLFCMMSALAFSQQAPQIRTERKELKREHFSAKEQKLEMRIRHDKRELRHMRNGQHHEWNHYRPHRPLQHGIPHRRPMMDHKRK